MGLEEDHHSPARTPIRTCHQSLQIREGYSPWRGDEQPFLLEGGVRQNSGVQGPQLPSICPIFQDPIISPISILALT